MLIRTMLAACVLAAPTLHAQAPAGALELKTVVAKLEQRAGEHGEVKSELVPVTTALPGDEVVYTVTFKNVGADRAANIQITNPIPAEMQYLADSAFAPGLDVAYSVDGGASYARAEELVVEDEYGGERLASTSEYTHIRWRLMSPLDAGAQGFARFRAVVR
jgi:uncharacterized repeat protein (TIGR01451 family)